MKNIEICKWYNNADSPVLFFIDDLANVWVDTNNDGKVDLGEDWGYAKREKNSSFNYLENIILKNFQDIKTTFFVPVGVRVGIIENPKIKVISKMINCDAKTKFFFKSINNDSKYEIAYHGTTHGKVGQNRNDFKQEWELFNSVDEAINIINKGKEIYKEVFGCYPTGGKYCGYESNQFSDESIDKTDFIWWSRYWNRGIEESCEDNICGNDKNLLTNYDIKFFGVNKVVDIPSTINGGLLSGVLNPNSKTIKGVAKIILKDYLIKKKLKQVDFLLNNKLVISVQEHMAPSRDDGRRQTPNIFDDEKSVRYIFNYLKNKNVWYCTGTELAEYVLLREKAKINHINNNQFELKINLNKHVDFEFITIKLNDEFKKVKAPNEKIYIIKNSIVNLPIINGIFTIE